MVRDEILLVGVVVFFVCIVCRVLIVRFRGFWCWMVIELVES